MKEFLEARYGLSFLLSLHSFDSDLQPGKFQFVLVALLLLAGVVFFGALGVIMLAVQLLNLLQIYLYPNISKEASVLVIGLVILADIITALLWILSRSVQPYETFEDFHKLTRLERRDQKKYQEIIDDIVRRHLAKGLWAQVFGRPKMKKLP